MEERFTVSVDGSEVEQDDLNLMATTGSLADDRLLADFVRLTPFNGTTATKSIYPYGSGTNRATVTPSGTDGKVKVFPFRMIVGSRVVASIANALDNWRDIRSGVYAVSTDGTTLGETLTLAANASGNARWDLVYAKLSVEANGQTNSRYIKDPTTGAISPQNIVTSLKCPVVVGVITGTPGASPDPPALTADSGSDYYTTLAYVRVPNGFGAASTVLTTDIDLVAAVSPVARTTGACSLMPADSNFTRGGAALTAARHRVWGSGGTRPVFVMPAEMVGGESRFFAIDLLNAASANWSHQNGAVLDRSIDWRKRAFKWAAAADGGSFSWEPGANGGVPSTVPSNRGSGFGQSFNVDAGQALGGGVAALLDVATYGFTGASPAALYVDNATGELKLNVNNATTYTKKLFVWLEATAPFGDM